MADSFQYIKDHLDAKELEKQRLVDEAKYISEERERIWNAERELWKPYSEMVLEVLTELRNLYYRTCNVSDSSIFTYYSYKREIEFLEVYIKLEFDKHYTRAIAFVCKRRGSYEKRTWWGGKKFVNFGEVKCGLNRQDLVAALQKLHPIDSLR